MSTIQQLGDAFERQGRKAKITLMAGPGVGWLVLLILLPMVFLMTVSFANIDSSYNIEYTFSLANYHDLFIGPDGLFQTPFISAFLLSMYIATITTFVTIVFAYPVAYLLARLQGQAFKLLIFLILVPFFTIYIVRIYSWYAFFGQSGIINSSLQTIGIISQPIGMFEFGFVPVVIALTHAYFPYMLLTLYSSLDGLDYSVVEASRDLGATRLGIAKDIIVPLSAQGLITGCIFVFVPALGSFITPQFLARGHITMVAEVLTTRITEMYAIGYGAAGSMFLIVPTLVAFTIILRYTNIEKMRGM